MESADNRGNFKSSHLSAEADWTETMCTGRIPLFVSPPVHLSAGLRAVGFRKLNAADDIFSEKEKIVRF